MEIGRLKAGRWLARLVCAAVLSALFFPFSLLHAQNTDWDRVEALMDDGSYKSAFREAEKVYNKRHTSSEDVLAAVWYMSRAGAQFAEENGSRNVERLREALPRLEAPERAVAYLLLGVCDSALMDDSILIATPATRVKRYCTSVGSVPLTTTVFDVVAFGVADLWNGQSKNDSALALLRRIAALHKEDGDDVRIAVDYEILSAIPHVVSQGGDGFFDSVGAYIDKYRASRSPLRAKLYYLMAEQLCTRQDYVAGVRYCDTAMAVGADLPVGRQAARLRHDVCAGWVELDNDEANTVVTLDEPSLHRMVYRNLSHLHMAVYPYDGKQKAFFKNPGKPVREWDLELPDDGSHRYHAVWYDVPSLPRGRYLLVASPDGKVDKHQAYIELQSTDIMVNHTSPACYQLVDRRTGDPVAGQEVSLLKNDLKKETLLASACTDADGRVCFEVKENWFMVKIVRGGVEMTFASSQMVIRADEDEVAKRVRAHTVCDRPVYRPGDTVRVAGFLFRAGGTDGRVVSGYAFSATLMDPDGEVLDSLPLVTDDFGAFSFSLPLWLGAKGGLWQVTLFDSSASFHHFVDVNVEAYKQPKFFITLNADGGGVGYTAPAFGKPLSVKGVATAYHGAALAGARVRYRVVRRPFHPWWHQGEEVEAGETVTAADGGFLVGFVPQRDSTLPLDDKSACVYTVSVEVTDLDGETQESSVRFTINRASTRLSMEDVGELSRGVGSLTFSLTDLDGRPVRGEVDFVVERLQCPATLRLVHPVMQQQWENTTHLLSRERFRTLFPRYAYTPDEVRRERWATDWTLERSYLTDDDSSAHTLELPELPSGVYRISARSGEVADTQYVTITRPTNRSVESGDLFWADVDRAPAAVGSTVTLRYASAYKDVRLYYTLSGPDGRERDRRWLTAQRGIRRLAIPVDSSLNSGFSISVFAVKDGCRHLWMRHISVPLVDKELKVEIATFRDKLEPGEEEVWTVKVGRPAALTLAMYDAALDTYGGFVQWNFNPWRQPLYRHFSWLYNYHQSGSYQEERVAESVEWGADDGRIEKWEVNREAFLGDDGLVEEVVFQTAGLGRGVAMLAEVEEADVSANDAAVMRKNVVAAPMVAHGGLEGGDGLRSNLGTLAFFAPGLRTDSNGMVTYRFTAPGLLTRWSVKGIAFTPDLRTGTLDRSLVTQKRLMVQPNVPRFLRQGDNVTMMAKVVNLSDDSRDIVVDFSLSDSGNDSLVVLQSKRVAVPAQGSRQVTFTFFVPRTLRASTYTISANTDDEVYRPRLPWLSDGERGSLPVLSDREIVTMAKALYINGVGEKEFAMELPDADPVALTVQLVSNPLRLALEAIPHIEETENPSSLYLANQFFVNSLAAKILSAVDASADTISIILTEKRLFDRQNEDGGWGWMPDGESSPWVTLQILKLLGSLDYPVTRLVGQSLSYIDSELQLRYERLAENGLLDGCHLTPDVVDFLYTRSLFGKPSSQAFKFFYSNVKKHYKKCEQLYTQAQLALLFQRMGDRCKARDIVRRLKEKSLESDEMGLYWRDNRGSWCWYERPVETQALLVKAFAAVTPRDTISIALMQQWILKQKQTTHWGNDQATAKAIEALLTDSRINAIKQSSNNTLSLTLFDTTVTAERTPFTVEGTVLDSLVARRSTALTLRKQEAGIAWGAVFYQFEDNIEEVPLSESGVSVTRTLVADSTLRVGDRVKVRIEFSCDRTLDYLLLVDERPSCLEPVSTRSGWRWNASASYYLSVENTANRCYFERLEKGRYVIEYECYVTNPGSFLTGTLSLQSLYAPEFRATAPAQRLTVEP